MVGLSSGATEECTSLKEVSHVVTYVLNSSQPGIIYHTIYIRGGKKQ